MGDRANIAIKQNHRTEGGRLVKLEKSQLIFFYTHWQGSVLPLILQDALKRGRGRWGDDAYLARIIFCEMIKDSVLDETGYGISMYVPDSDGYPLLVVDGEGQTVEVWHDADGEQIGASLTFSEFVNTHLSVRDPWASLTAAVNAKADAMR